jgi:hypothetical protein
MKLNTILSALVIGLMFSFISRGESINGTNNVTKANTGYINQILDAASLPSDYFRSKTSGDWHDITTWETSSDSINWADATLAPDHQAAYTIIRPGTTVYVLQQVIISRTVIDSGGTVIVGRSDQDTTVVMEVANSPAEVDLRVYGTLIATGEPRTSDPFTVNPVGVISFEDGSVYEHAQNGGAIPISIWKPGSTFRLTKIKDTAPYNRAQNYSNIVIDLPELSFHLNMHFRDNVISGDINILNTGTSRVLLVGPVTDDTRTVTIMGDIIQSNGHFSSHGTENPNSTAIIHSMGNIIVTGGNFSLTRGTQGGTGTTTWYLHGDLSITNAVTQNGNPTGAKFVFTGEGERNLHLENVTYGAGGLPLEVQSTTLKLGSSILRGSGMFILGAGSVLGTSLEEGINSALQNTGFTSLSVEAGYLFNGTAPQVPGDRLPETMSSISVDNPAGLTLNKDITVNEGINIHSGSLYLDGKTITLGSNAIMTESGGSVTGTSGKIVTTREINTPSALNAGGMGVVITSSANLGITTLVRDHSPAAGGGGNKGIYRQYSISPSNNSSLDATLRIYYSAADLGEITEANLRLFSSADGSDDSWWMREATVNTTEKWGEISGLDMLGYWTFADMNTPLPVEEEITDIPREFSLYQNYPNPFNPETIIRFDLPEGSFVNLSIYNAIGEKILTLVDQEMEQGRHSKTFNAVNLPSGIYIYKIITSSSVYTRKMILMK